MEVQFKDIPIEILDSGSRSAPGRRFALVPAAT
jgi:hypothetical protein